jgi:hypothetical protein
MSLGSVTVLTYSCEAPSQGVRKAGSNRNQRSANGKMVWRTEMGGRRKKLPFHHGGTETRRETNHFSCRPYGTRECFIVRVPGAKAPGYFHSPLRGCCRREAQIRVYLLSVAASPAPRSGGPPERATGTGVSSASPPAFSGRSSGKRMTSRMERESVNNIVTRSMPRP